ncbi:hypothetical protein RR48_10173 [Papilio machaon]|uniref:Uncharacterized protein n=1 Tax=Papilio machaon TaxID=76193 RepID=A0A194QZM5_PAPMA|nr:hypothetical protein RR48_10173 [Papilio machaon]
MCKVLTSTIPVGVVLLALWNLRLYLGRRSFYSKDQHVHPKSAPGRGLTADIQNNSHGRCTGTNQRCTPNAEHGEIKPPNAGNGRALFDVYFALYMFLDA